MRIRRAAVAVSTVLVVAACTQEVRGVASAGPASSDPSTGSPAPAPDRQVPDAPGGPADQAGPAQPGSGGDPAAAARITGFSFESGGDLARLVIDLGGSGVPEWTVGYSEASGPAGEPVDVAGDAFLRVRVRGGTEGGSQGSSQVSVSSGPVAEAVTTGAAEGWDEVLVGIRGGQRPFDVQPLTDPGRLVVEIRG